MPQNQRSIAFSNKKKKEQLRAKRERKNCTPTSDCTQYGKIPSFEKKTNSNQERKIPEPSKPSNVSLKLKGKASLENYYLEDVEEIQGGGARSKQDIKYNLKFRRQQNDISGTSKLRYAHVSLLPEEELEVTGANYYPPGLDYPRRPSWKKNWSRDELDRNENKSFRLFCENIDKNFDCTELSLYELNLETWRQLWRVTEMSDVLLIIVDARFAAVQFPPYLYNYLVEKEKRNVILILNKCDLLHPALVLAWQDYFLEKYPKLIILPFSSVEGRAFQKTNFKIAKQSSLMLIEACRALVGGYVDLNLWRNKVESENTEKASKKSKVLEEHPVEVAFPEIYERFRNGILTIGTIGYPNVGKSSLINALMGKKVVSVSKTPGHTKHFQTIFITKNVKLCDCPGLVFPSLCPKQLQVILGSYPIAQVRDPFASVHYIASRIDLPSLLKLRPEEQNDSVEEKFEWNPYLICEAWARRRSYFTRTRGGRLDVFRAANELLRLTLVGLKSLVVSLKPPGYSHNKEKYKSDPRVHEIQLIYDGMLYVTPEEQTKPNRKLLETDEKESECSASENDESDCEECDTHADSSDRLDDFETHEVNKFALLSSLDC